MKMTKLVIALCGLTLLFCAKLDKELQWDNPVDPNGTIPQPTITAMSDTTVPIYDTVILHAKGTSKLGRIIRYYWTFDNGLAWETVNDSTGILKHAFLPSPALKDSNWTVQVKVADTFGTCSRISKSATFHVLARQLAPILVPVHDTVASKYDSVKISVTVFDTTKTRYIKYFYWSKLGTQWKDTTDSAWYTFLNPQGGTDTVVLQAQDDDGLTASDTFTIRFNRPPDSLRMSKPVNGSIASFETFNLTTAKGSVVLNFKASDPDGPSDTLTYTLYFKKEQSMDKVYEGKDTTFTIDNLDTSKVYSWALHVRDSLGDSMNTKGAFSTPSVDLTPPRITLKGSNPTKLPLCSQYKDSGATAFDNVDGDISNKIIVSGADSVNTWVVDTYKVTYTVSDKMGNTTDSVRLVIIESYFVLEDFETGPENQSTFGAFSGAVNTDSIGCWSAWTDKQIGLNTHFDPDPYVDPSAPFKNIVLSGAGFNTTKGLDVIVYVDADTNHYYKLGFNLKNKNVYYNLSGLDSITLYAKGDDVTANIRVQFTDPHIDSLPVKQRWGYAGMEITISQTWKRFTLLPKDLKGIPGSPGNGLTWDKVKTKIKMIQFVNPTGDFYDQRLAFDDIKIYGDFKNSGLIP